MDQNSSLNRRPLKKQHQQQQQQLMQRANIQSSCSRCAGDWRQHSQRRNGDEHSSWCRTCGWQPQCGSWSRGGTLVTLTKCSLSLLIEPTHAQARVLLSDPRCLKDEWTLNLLSVFNNEKLVPAGAPGHSESGRWTDLQQSAMRAGHACVCKLGAWMHETLEFTTFHPGLRIFRPSRATESKRKQGRPGKARKRRRVSLEAAGSCGSQDGQAAQASQEEAKSAKQAKATEGAAGSTTVTGEQRKRPRDPELQRS